MAKPKKGKDTQQDRAGDAGARSMQSGSGGMGGPIGGDAGSRQSAEPDPELPIQTGGERIGVGHHRQGRQTGGLHQPNIADELAAESAPDQATPARTRKGKT